MKTLRSKLPHLTVAVPVHGGFQVTFADHRAAAPDDVADLLVALHPTFYQITGGGLPAPGGSVLVTRDMGLGDVLLTTPLIRALATRHGLRVSVATLSRYVPLLDGNPHVAECFAIEEGRDTGGYDAALDLRLYVENAEGQGDTSHRVDGFARAADVRLGDGERALDYFVTADERAEAEASLRGPANGFPPAGGGPLVGLVWRSSAANRNWPAPRSREVLAALLAAGMGVVVLDQEPQDLGGSAGHPALLDATGRLSIRQVAAAMQVCDAVLCPDTGLFHLASALDVPVVTYFGPFPAAERATHRRLTVLDERRACGIFPCRRYTCLRRAEGTEMSACLDVPVARVVDAVRAACG